MVEVVAYEGDDGLFFSIDTALLYTEFCLNDKAIQQLDALILAGQGVTVIAGALGGITVAAAAIIVGIFQLYRAWIKSENRGRGVYIHYVVGLPPVVSGI